LLATIDAVDEWHRLRRLLRFAILCGDVVESGQDWQAWGPGGGLKIRAEGVDTNRRMEYWQVLKALLQLRSNDPFGHELLRRHVGYHCEGERCRPPESGLVHWHQISLTDLRSRGHENGTLHARREAAMEYVVRLCDGSID
jgi:hypothetical protein